MKVEEKHTLGQKNNMLAFLRQEEAVCLGGFAGRLVGHNTDNKAGDQSHPSLLLHPEDK